MKKTYQITFKAELTEDDVRAMNKCFYDAMNESMDIHELWGLQIEEIDSEDIDDIPDIKEAQKYTMHIDDVVDGLKACETIEEVRDFLDTIPRKFGEWWVDEVLDEDGKGYYEVTNEYYEYGELQVDTYELDIEMENEDEYVEIEFFGSDEGDLDAEDYVKENDIEDYEIEWDDYRKGYSLRVPKEN